MAFVGKALELISPEKGLESVRPWWDVVSGLIADAMTVISLVSISLQLFGGFGSAVKCVPVRPNMDPSIEDIQQVPWSQRQLIDSWCVEKDMRFYAKYLGYVLFVQVWILMAIDNFWLKWSKSACKLQSFIALTDRCAKSKCDHKMIQTQLKRATGEKVEHDDDRQGGFTSSQLVKVESKEIEEALILSDKSMKIVDVEIKSSLLANIYITKTVLKLVVASIVFALALYRLLMKDFRFTFSCDVARLNRHEDVERATLENNATYFKIASHERFECTNVVGPFSKYVLIAFLVLTLGYILVSFVALLMFYYIRNPLREILAAYEETSFKEDMEVKIENLMKNKTKDIVFLLFFLYTTNKETFKSFKEFLSPLFHDDLIRLATNRKWNEAEMERRKIPLGGDEDGFSISLADVELSSLPACLFSVTKLKELDLSFNESLVNLDGIEKLVDLTVLKVESCKLQDLNFMIKLPKLQRVEAADNLVPGLPEGLDKLKELTYLDVKNNEPMEGLPEALNAMTRVTELHADFELVATLDPDQRVWIPLKDMQHAFRRRGTRMRL